MVFPKSQPFFQDTDKPAAGFEYKAALTADLKANPLVASVHDVGKHPNSLSPPLDPSQSVPLTCMATRSTLSI
jgi:hypothetical protein